MRGFLYRCGQCVDIEEINPFISVSYMQKISPCKGVTQAKEVVPGTASILWVMFFAKRMITLINTAVCDRFLRIFIREK